MKLDTQVDFASQQLHGTISAAAWHAKEGTVSMCCHTFIGQETQFLDVGNDDIRDGPLAECIHRSIRTEGVMLP